MSKFSFGDYMSGAWRGYGGLTTGQGSGTYGTYTDPTSGATVDLNQDSFNAIKNTGEGLGDLKINSQSFKDGQGLGTTLGDIGGKAASVLGFGKGVYDIFAANKAAKNAQDNFDKQFGLQKHQQKNADTEIARINKQRKDNTASYNKKS